MKYVLMINYTLRILFSCLFSLYIYSGSAQFNIKVGYVGSYTNLEKTKEIFNLYNAEFESLEKKFTPINFYNGIELGARYKFGDYIGFDLGLNTSSGRTTATGISSVNNASVNNRMRIQLTNYYVGLESYFGTYGCGATIGHQKIKYSNKLSSQDEEIFSQNVLNSKFYLILEVESNQTAFSLRPFVSTNWEPYNIQALETTLIPDSTRPSSEFDEDLV